MLRVRRAAGERARRPLRATLLLGWLLALVFCAGALGSTARRGADASPSVAATKAVAPFQIQLFLKTIAHTTGTLKLFRVILYGVAKRAEIDGGCVGCSGPGGFNSFVRHGTQATSRTGAIYVTVHTRFFWAVSEAGHFGRFRLYGVRHRHGNWTAPVLRKGCLPPGYVATIGSIQALPKVACPHKIRRRKGHKPSFFLSATTAGNGSGSVQGSGISCPGTCSHRYVSGTLVSLTASPAAGSTFAGWSGACSGKGACSFRIPSNEAVVATFTKPVLTVTRAGSGSGSVSGGGISCPSTCSESVPIGTQVTLSAAAAHGSYFSGWGGACSGSGSCTVTVNSNTSVTASFPSFPVNYVVDVDDNGVTNSGLGGSGSFQASGTGNVQWGAGQECAHSGNGGPFSFGYPPGNCGSVGRGYASPANSFAFTGNQYCVNANRPFSGSTFTWHVQLPESGRWHVDAYIPEWTSYGWGDTYSGNADDGSWQANVTQQAYHGSLVLLTGGHPFTAGRDYTVTLGLSDNADPYCHYQMADQVRWVYDGP